LYGGNPEKRKALRQLRDYWWCLMDERRAHVTEAASLDDSLEISEDSHAKGALHSRGVAIYHIIFPEEDFSTSARQLFELVRSAQEKEPNKRRHLILDIQGHRTEQGGFDHAAFELQRQFLLGFMFQYLTELHMPLISVRKNKAQSNDIPDSLDIVEELSKEGINAAIDKGVGFIWIADRDKPLRLG
jgi:hypothetical protein